MTIVRSNPGNSTALILHTLTPTSELKEELGDLAMPYVEFQTKMLKLFEKIRKKQLSTKAAFLELIKTDSLFRPNNQGDNELLICWPHGKVQRKIKVKPKSVQAENDNFIALEFFSKECLFLTISFDHDNVIKVQHHQQNAEWNNIDISNLVDNFNEVLRAKRIIYINNKKTNEMIVELHKNNINCFNKDEFAKFIHQYRDYNLTFRINNIILNNSSRRGNQYTFKLIWPDALHHCRLLKVIFSRTDLFNENYSWFVDEKTLLTEFHEYNQADLKSGQYYCSIRVNEETARNAPKETELLSLWLTLDGMLGELRDIKKSANFTGNDVLAIYVYLQQLFQIKNTFICDESKLVNRDQNIRVPLRLISSIATGKTWYESKLPGVTLFECHQFETANNGKITQNRVRRNLALNQLQSYFLSDWYAVLDLSARRELLDLYMQKVQGRRSSRLLARAPEHDYKKIFGQTTVKDLVARIYLDAKQQKIITTELVNLVGLLCEGIDLCEDNKQLCPTLVDYWLKSRVKELLWRSYFWVNKVVEQSSDLIDLRK